MANEVTFVGFCGGDHPNCPMDPPLVSPPPTKTLNIFAILPFRPSRIGLPPVNCVYTTQEDLRILSSVFLMEMFDLRGKELKYAW